MRIFLIHLSSKTCQEHQLFERDISYLKKSLSTSSKHSVEIFDAIYSKTKTGLHPLVKAHLHPCFTHPSCGVTPNIKDTLSAYFYALKYKGKCMSLGELGCYASHFCLWYRCLEYNEPIVILEDDIELEPCFWQSLDFLEEHIHTLGYVRLMHLFELPKKPTHFTRVLQIIGYHDGKGTQGYCLTPQAAMAFIKVSAKWVIPVDVLMDNTYLHGISNFVLEPFAIAEKPNSSNIERFSQEKFSIGIRLLRRINHLYVKYT
ncbi:glycosyltransferase family 25 protein [Helicobacter suis]|uniref:glycosyltransferase family 25 protein n=1 Tax=Helicobacter suis TaxID=104628 RepID=UPI001968A23B|nr:glycosyltransferase family 25 protein [Helicobacter suis]